MFVAEHPSLTFDLETATLPIRLLADARKAQIVLIINSESTEKFLDMMTLVMRIIQSGKVKDVSNLIVPILNAGGYYHDVTTTYMKQALNEVREYVATKNCIQKKTF